MNLMNVSGLWHGIAAGAAAWLTLAGPAAGAVSGGYDFSRYQVIIDRKPFGEVAPTEAVMAAAPLGEAIGKDLEMKAIIDDGTAVRVGFLDKKSNKTVFIGVGENHEGLEVVSVNYEGEEAVVRKGAETAVVKLRPDKDNKGGAVTPAGAPALSSANPFAAAVQAEPGARRPFFADLKKRQVNPFRPLGTNATPFQAKPLDSFFKVSTGQFPRAQSPFMPFQPASGASAPAGFQQIQNMSSNAPNPFMPATAPAEQTRGATMEQFIQADSPDQNQQGVSPFAPVEGTVQPE